MADVTESYRKYLQNILVALYQVSDRYWSVRNIYVLVTAARTGKQLDSHVDDIQNEIQHVIRMGKKDEYESNIERSMMGDHRSIKLDYIIPDTD